MARVAVVGGGPGGLMAAEVLASAGHDVLVIEQMPSVGRKLLVAGRGGLNLTHSEPLPALLRRYEPTRPHLRAAIEAFTPADLRAWATGLGEEPTVGSSGRVFPASFRATRLLRRWKARLDDLGVTFLLGHSWTGFDDETAAGADAVVLALGGASWPATGSDGAWVPLVRAAGVSVAPLRPANCGFVVHWSAVFAERFAGRPLKNLALHFGDATARGDAMITDDGIEGGPVYALSRPLREAIAREGGASVTIDLRPDEPVEQLEARLARSRVKDSVATRLRRAGFAPAAIGLLREATGNELPGDAAALARLAKSAELSLVAPQPLARSISTAGGIELDEVDDRFMLRARPGTFVAGEMLDWDAPTGGYLLQATFSIAVAAARGVEAWLP